MILVRTLLLILLMLLACGPLAADETTQSASKLDAAVKRYTVSTQKPYDDVLEDLEFAITQNNYRITGRNQIGHAIGQSKGSAYPESTIVHFCSITAAQEIFEINPEFLLHMPCRITLRQEQGSVVIEARLVPENDAKLKDISLRINNMMRSIADYAAE